MDNRQSDRHKGPRNYQTGNEKRKKMKEKQKQQSELLSQTHRLTDFFTAKPLDSTGLNTSEKMSPVEEINDALSFETQNNTTEVQDTVETIPEQNRLNLDINNVQSKFETAETIFSDFDIGTWPENMQKYISYWLKLGNSNIQNCNAALISERSAKQTDMDKTRTCTIGMFERKLKNEQTVKRQWLCFSPKDGKLYCFLCKLLGEVQTQFSHGGYSDWKNATNRIAQHEMSSAHLNALLSFQKRSEEHGRIDFELTQQLEDETEYWRKVLQRIASVIFFICERGLSFRGDNEIIGSVRNGNYLGMLELMARHDDFLKDHIEKYGNRGQGKVSYLSSTICNEFRELIAKRVFDEIVNRIKLSYYYSISLDSTKDEGRIDQLVLIFRYIENNGDPVERFLTFMPNKGHKAREIFDALVGFLNDNGIDIKNCRGQSYDNASPMSGRFEGLQALVRKENNLAVWVPCFGHSLNLVGTDAMDSCTNAKIFFSFLEQIFVFFTCSTDRYKILVTTLKAASTQDKPLLIPKRVSTTRWSSRADATKALVRGYSSIKSTLCGMSEDNSEALGLYNQMIKLETGIYAVFWDEILDRCNNISKCLQSPDTNLNTSVTLLSSLKSFIQIQRDSFADFERQGAELSGTNEYAATKKRKCRPNVRLAPLDYGHTPEVVLSPSETFRTQSFIPVIDQFLSSLDKRIGAYKEIHDLFGFLSVFNELSTEKLREHAKALCNVYINDLDDNFATELIHFREFYSQYIFKKAEETSHERFMIKLLIEHEKVRDSFPNVEIMLKIYHCILTTNCSGERSFSKLKLIKDRLSTTMTQESLNDRTVLSTEYDIMRELDLSDLINEFASKKARKVPL